MSSLWLNGKNYSYEQLKQNVYQTEDLFEQKTLDFCHDWLNGKTEFQIQTSGSTGTPKIISFTRSQLQASANLTEEALQLKPGYNALVCLDAKYIAGQMMLVRCFVTGMNIFAVEPSANPFATVSKEIKIDFTALVPYQVQAILESEEKFRFNEMKTVIIGGALLSKSIQESLENFSCDFYATYGMTESISHIALQKLNGVDKQNNFFPLRSIEIEKDERGCLSIKAPHVSKQPIITNDLVTIHPDQSFQVLGRWDNIINSGGVKISSEKVEARISEIFSQHKINAPFFIGSWPDEKLGQQLILVVESTPWLPAVKNKLMIEIKNVVDKFENPKEIYFVGQFLRTETGKIKRIETTRKIAQGNPGHPANP
jgi:O-succinylbenzoic acid--CoA ligase